MNVLFVCPMPPDPDGDGAIPVLLHAEIEALRKRHNLSLITVAGPSPSEYRAIQILQDSGLDVHAVQRSNPTGIARWKRRWRFGKGWLRGTVPWRTVWFSEPGVQKILDRLLATRRYDLIHIEDNAAAAYDFSSDLPLLLTEHEVRRPRPMNTTGWKENGIQQWAFTELDWRRWQRYQPGVWCKSDRIQVFTERDAEMVRTMVPEVSDRIRLNPFPVTIPTGINANSESDGNILFVGNFTHQPNVDAARWLGTEILPLVRRTCPGATLNIVGGHAPASVRAMDGNGVSVTGFVPDLRPYFSQAAVVAAPIRIGGGMRMKVLQAMAYGKPVVTTNRGAAGLDVAGVAPPLRIAEDVRDFAEATAELLKCKKQRADLSRCARDFVVEHHSPEAYVKRLEVIYEEMIKEA